MAEEKLPQDIRTVERIIDDMDLFDDDLMSMVFDRNTEANHCFGLEVCCKVI